MALRFDNVNSRQWTVAIAPHAEAAGSETVWKTKERRTIHGHDVDVWTGRAQSATAGRQSFDLETSIAYAHAHGGARNATVPMFVNVSHPLWVSTQASVEGFSNDVDSNAWDPPSSCYK
jgi:hypothetical protein